MFFQHAFGNGIFSNVYTKNVILGVQLGPQLGVKNLQIFIIFVSGAPKTRWEPQKPPKACPGRLQEPPKASKMSFWTSKICIFLPQGYWKHKKIPYNDTMIVKMNISAFRGKNCLLYWLLKLIIEFLTFWKAIQANFIGFTNSTLHFGRHWSTEKPPWNSTVISPLIK